MPEGRIPWFPTAKFAGSAIRPLAAEVVRHAPVVNDLAAEAMERQMVDWECSACGWNVTAATLLPGWSIEDARDIHSDKYCARPPTWPPE